MEAVTNPTVSTAVILAAGLGTRMRKAASPDANATELTAEQLAAANAGAKGLIPVAGRPLLDHVLDALANGGIRDVVFVVAPGESAIRARYKRHARPTVRFAEQAAPRGTADGLLAAREAVAGITRTGGPGLPGSVLTHFLMLNADNLYPAESIAALLALDGPGLIAYDSEGLVAEGNIDSERVMQFALLDIGLDGVLTDIVEKPAADHPLARDRSRWVSMNLWRFTPEIFDDCASIAPSERGEFELADAVRHAIRARGERFRTIRQRLGVLDLSRRADIAAVEARLR